MMNPKSALFLFYIMLLQPAFAGQQENSGYIGRAICSECHEEQARQWVGSHHDLAMQPATADTVLGDFNNTDITQFGVTSTFFKKGDRFVVRTEGPDGKLTDYEIRYTFGVEPLQQYLIEFPGGRLQALSLAWDTRSKSQGGQRWFHLYPDEKIAYDDELHWTRPSQNWNNMCAECHSTRLKKNYDPLKRTFATTWSEINVSCEACHGPGAAHVTWAKKEPGWEKLESGKGLALLLDERKEVHWTINPKTGIMERNRPRSSEKEIEMCARCHSRRSPISGDYVHGEALLDHYRPSLLDEDIYFVDGQIQDEVYVYGSFLQSKMYHAGVTCSDCHEPHSTELKVPGNGVCLQCHQADNYDQSSHHFHKPDKAGGSCAECHMPPRTYMVVDPRHDHSMRIPRPDLSEQLGTPNACNNCHTDKDSKWAVDNFRKWYPGQPESYQQYTESLAAGRNESANAEQLLAALIRDVDTPDIARATALSAMVSYLSRESFDTLQVGLTDENPLLRVAAIEVIQPLPPAPRVKLAFPLLSDPVRAVRMEAARALADIPTGPLPGAQQAVLDKAMAEYIEAQQASAERPEAQSNLGELYAAQGKTEMAVVAFKTAIELNPAFTPGYVNLADLYRSQGNEEAAEQTLRQALAVSPSNADVQFALGLSLVRQQRNKEAVEALRLASMGAPDNARYVYVYGVALNSTGNPEQAVLVLQGAHKRFPNNTDILNALVAFHRDMGNDNAARTYMEKLQAIPR